MTPRGFPLQNFAGDLFLSTTSLQSPSAIVSQMSFLKRPYAYSKMEIEDPEERAHRQAQFLIHKVLEQTDLHSRRRPTTLKVMRICKVKVKIGKRLKTLRKNMLVNISKARINLYRKIMAQLKTLKRLIRSEEAMVSLPAPMLIN